MRILSHISTLPHVVKLWQISLGWLFIITYLFTSVGGATLFKEVGHQIAHILQDYASTSYHTHSHTYGQPHHPHYPVREQALEHTHKDGHHHGNWLTVLSKIAQNETDSDPEELTLIWKDLISFPLKGTEHQYPDLYGDNSPMHYQVGIEEIYLPPLTPPPRPT